MSGRGNNSDRSAKTNTKSDAVVDAGYEIWRDTYLQYIVVIFSDFQEILKRYKVKTTKDITLEDFSRFAFQNSSKFISSFA